MQEGCLCATKAPEHILISVCKWVRVCAHRMELHMPSLGLAKRDCQHTVSPLSSHTSTDGHTSFCTVPSLVGLTHVTHELVPSSWATALASNEEWALLKALVDVPRGLLSSDIFQYDVSVYFLGFYSDLQIIFSFVCLTMEGPFWIRIQFWLFRVLLIFLHCCGKWANP